MAVPACFVLGFALRALTLGIGMVLGIRPGSVAGSIVFFRVLSLVTYVALRMMLRLDRGQVKIWDRDINDN